MLLEYGCRNVQPNVFCPIGKVCEASLVVVVGNAVAQLFRRLWRDRLNQGTKFLQLRLHILWRPCDIGVYVLWFCCLLHHFPSFFAQFLDLPFIVELSKRLSTPGRKIIWS